MNKIKFRSIFIEFYFFIFLLKNILINNKKFVRFKKKFVFT
jgi:hypothetical protein